MKLLSEIFFLLRDVSGLSDLTLPEDPEGSCLSIVINSHNVRDLPTIYLKVTANSGKFNFCLAFDLEPDTLTDTLLYDVCAILFIKNYRFHAGSPVILLLGDNQEYHSILSAQLTTFLKKQGMKAAAIRKVKELLDFSGTLGEMNELVRKQVVKTYSHLITSCSPVGIFASVGGSSDIQKVISACQGAELNIKKEQPDLYSLLAHNKFLTEQVLQLSGTVSYLQESLTHQKDYLAFINTNHEAREIQTFYNKQYEVLPLWYKRFGHVLKYLMRR